MSDIHWVTLLEVMDRLQAEMIKGALDAQNIPAEIFQESAMLYAYTGGRIQICVPNNRIEEAHVWLTEYLNGQIEIPPDDEKMD